MFPFEENAQRLYLGAIALVLTAMALSFLFSLYGHRLGKRLSKIKFQMMCIATSVLWSAQMLAMAELYEGVVDLVTIFVLFCILYIFARGYELAHKHFNHNLMSSSTFVKLSIGGGITLAVSLALVGHFQQLVG
jgi:hypothetical protein